MLLLAIAALPAGAATQYQTSFDATQNPISESGVWKHTGLDWTYVATESGYAHGTMAGTGYDDSYAYLSGFPNDHRGEATVYIPPNADPSCYKEVEILLRWSDSAHSAQGYEVTFTSGGLVGVTVWDGPYNTYHTIGTPGHISLTSGTVVRAEIVGNTITAYVDGVQKYQVTDNTYATGQPGIGFFRHSCGTTRDIGYSSFTATGLGSAPAPAPQPTPPPPPVLLP